MSGDSLGALTRRAAIGLLACWAAVAAPAAQPVVWLAPMDTLTGSEIPSWVPIHGSYDYFDLFSPASPWPIASSHIAVLKLYAGGAGQMSDDQLRQVVSYTRAHGIRLAVEMGMISSDQDKSCGSGMEGFGSRNYAVWLCNRIAAAGGELSYVAFDEPFFNASISEVPQACRWEPATVAARVWDTLQAMRSVFPNLAGGDIEPVVVQPSATNADVTAEVGRYAAWFDAWRRTTGEPLAFFHTDVNWWRADWYAQVSALRREVEARGIPFGMIYNGGYDATSDASWIAAAERHISDFELRSCRPPDQVIVQSWDVYPRHVLPESDPATLTYLVDRYFRQRTQIWSAASAAAVVGGLAGDDGRPLAGKPVTVTARGIERGLPFDFTIEGTVPPNAAQAIVGLRVNTECVECTPGSASLVVYGMTYAEEGGANRVPNADFAGGLKSWGYSGSGTAKVAASDAGSGSALYLSVPFAKTASLNSTVMNVTPGAHFRATFRAAVPAGATQTGGFMVEFLNVSRTYAYLESPAIEIARATTDTAGRFSVVAAIRSGVQYSAHFDGDEADWPAAPCALRRHAVSH